MGICGHTELVTSFIEHAITNACYRAHTKLLFLQLNVLDIYQINTFYTANFFFTITILYHSLPFFT